MPHIKIHVVVGGSPLIHAPPEHFFLRFRGTQQQKTGSPFSNNSLYYIKIHVVVGNNFLIHAPPEHYFYRFRGIQQQKTAPLFPTTPSIILKFMLLWETFF